MQNVHSNKLNMIAKKLFLLSFFLFLLSYYLLSHDYKNKLSFPFDTNVKDDKAIISIETVDGSEIVPGNTVVSDGSLEVGVDNGETEIRPTPRPNTGNSSYTDPIGNSNYDNSNSNTNTNTNTNTNVSKSPSSNNNSNLNNNVTIDNKNKESLSSIDNLNLTIKNNIYDKYKINVLYGDDTVGYTVAGISTNPITDDYKINSTLNKLDNVLSLYPDGFFQEIVNGGIPLTIYLINSYSQENVGGVTDSSFSNAVISIAIIHPFEESFYHESYHYIERYMFKKGVNFNSWKTFNPSGFEYGNVYNNLSYSNTFKEDAYFVNNYAQTDDKEDRASTFEYMMAPSKAICLNQNSPIWFKSVFMAKSIDSIFNSVNSDTVEYWERFL